MAELKMLVLHGTLPPFRGYSRESAGKGPLSQALRPALSARVGVLAVGWQAFAALCGRFAVPDGAGRQSMAHPQPLSLRREVFSVLSLDRCTCNRFEGCRRDRPRCGR